MAGKRKKKPEIEVVEIPQVEQISLSRYRTRRRKEQRLGVLMVAGDPVTVDLRNDPVVGGDPADGFFYAAESAIVLNTNLAPWVEWEVLYHEIIHAVCYKYGLHLEDEAEEKLATVFGKALVQALLPWQPRRGVRPWVLGE